MTWIGGTKSISEAEMSGIIKQCIPREHPGASKVSQRLVLMLMRTVRRLNLVATMPNQVKKLEDLFEAAMLASWPSLKRT